LINKSQKAIRLRKYLQLGLVLTKELKFEPKQLERQDPLSQSKHTPKHTAQSTLTLINVNRPQSKPLSLEI
jgi:hypothetical protein